jgi:hypothetical protein
LFLINSKLAPYLEINITWLCEKRWLILFLASAIPGVGENIAK